MHRREDNHSKEVDHSRFMELGGEKEDEERAFFCHILGTSVLSVHGRNLHHRRRLNKELGRERVYTKRPR